MTNTNANDLLISDHREVEDTYETYRTTDGDERDEAAKKILTDLTVHASIEEEFYYPELEAIGEKELADTYRNEHQEMKKLIGKITVLPMGGENQTEHMEELMRIVMEHVEEEESEGMPLMEKLLGTEKLEEMAPKMQERKKELRESTFKRLWASITS